jgi:hypothetical protein
VNCIAVASIVVGLVIALILRARYRRRAAKHDATAIERNVHTISPFTLITQTDVHDAEMASLRDSDRCSMNASTIARQQLETELRAVDEQMVDLPDLKRSTSTGVTAGSGTRGVWRLMSMRNSSRRGSPGFQAQLEAAREQINIGCARTMGIPRGC